MCPPLPVVATRLAALDLFRCLPAVAGVGPCPPVAAVDRVLRSLRLRLDTRGSVLSRSRVLCQRCAVTRAGNE